MDKLLPCPMCGSKAVFGINKSCCARTVRIDCTNTQCGANINAFSSKVEAIAAWNRRAQQEPLICPLLSDDEVKQPCIEGPCPAYQPKNKPLTCEELKSLNMQEPVWDDCLHSWCAVRGEQIAYFGGGNRPLEENRFYRFKPKEE